MLEVTVNIPDQILNAEQEIKDVQRRAANRAGFAASKEISDSLLKMRPSSHPMSALFQSGARWQKSRRVSYNPYSSLAPFARHVVHGYGIVTFGFGYFRGGDKGKKRYDRNLTTVARRVTEERNTKVTPKMRRKIAATKGVIGNTPGQHFWPLRKNTTMLRKPARDMNVERAIAVANDTFANQFNALLKEKL
jgi:hypothetical protein